MDVLSAIDLGALMAQHRASGALATLAVQPRTSGRGLLFDAEGRLVGWEESPGGRRKWAGRAVPGAERLAFCGIHAAGPALLGRLSETGAFPIVDAYLRLAGEGADIRAFRADGVFWADVGNAEKLGGRAQAGRGGATAGLAPAPNPCQPIAAVIGLPTRR